MRTRVLLSTIAGALIVLGALGCAERESAVEFEAHPAAWNTEADVDFHGAKVARDGPDFCRSCHGAELRGSLRANSCYECHEGPSGHPGNWLISVDGDHRSAVALEGIDGCARCHGEDFMGGWSGVSCFTCHLGPSGHPEGWLNIASASSHAGTVSRISAESCMACHGDDYAGGWSGVSCFTCHAGGPSGHPTDWMLEGAGDFHGREVAEVGVDGCAACHGSDFDGGWSAVSCFTCHAGGPSGHPSGWLDSNSADFHGDEVEQSGTDGCAGCHGSDFEGGWSGVDCFGCHEGGQSGHPGGWMISRTPAFHGNEVAQNGTQPCAGCHGSDFDGGWSRVSCFTCHAGGPSGHPEGWMNPFGSSFHGTEAAQVGTERCAECHGEDFDGGWSGVSCRECHD